MIWQLTFDAVAYSGGEKVPIRFVFRAPYEAADFHEVLVAARGEASEYDITLGDLLLTEVLPV